MEQEARGSIGTSPSSLIREDYIKSVRLLLLPMSSLILKNRARSLRRPPISCMIKLTKLRWQRICIQGNYCCKHHVDRHTRQRLCGRVVTEEGSRKISHLSSLIGYGKLISSRTS